MVSCKNITAEIPWKMRTKFRGIWERVENENVAKIRCLKNNTIRFFGKSKIYLINLLLTSLYTYIIQFVNFWTFNKQKQFVYLLVKNKQIKILFNFLKIVVFCICDIFNRDIFTVIFLIVIFYTNTYYNIEISQIFLYL